MNEENKESAWCKNLYQDTKNKVYAIYKTHNSLCKDLNKGKFDYINNVLKNIEIHKVDIEYIYCVLGLLSHHQDKLPNWHDFKNQACKILSSKGYNLKNQKGVQDIVNL